MPHNCYEALSLTPHLVWLLYIYVHCALWVSARCCTPVYPDKWACIIPQRCAS